MSAEIDVDQVLVVPRNDPVYSVFVWRRDSITLARLRPILNQLRDIPDRTCQVDATPYSCMEWGSVVKPCLPCQVRRIKTILFDESQEQE